MLALYLEARKLGFNFRSLKEEVATSSDVRVREILSKYPKEVYELLLRGSEREWDADVAGLVALVKTDFDEDLIRRVADEIGKESFFRTIPGIRSA